MSLLAKKAAMMGGVPPSGIRSVDTGTLTLAGFAPSVVVPADAQQYPLTGVSRISSPNFGQDDVNSASDRAAIGMLDASLLQGLDSGGHMDIPLANYVTRAVCNQEVLDGSTDSSHYLFTYFNMMEAKENGNFEETYLDAVNGPGASDGWVYDDEGAKKSFFVNHFGANLTDEVAVDGSGFRYPEAYANDKIDPDYTDVMVAASVPVGGKGACNVMLDNFQAHANKSDTDWDFDGTSHDTKDYWDTEDLRHTAQDIVVSSITRSGSTATATTATDHGLSEDTARHIIVAGANQSEYNGTFDDGDGLSRISDTQFSYTVSGSPATPATGTITSTLADRYESPCHEGAEFYSQWRTNYKKGRDRIITNTPAMIIMPNTNQWGDDRDPLAIGTWTGNIAGIPKILKEYQLGGDPDQADTHGGFSEGNVGLDFPRSGVTQAGVSSGQAGSWQKSRNSALVTTRTMQEPKIFFMSASIECLQAGTNGADGRKIYPPEPDATSSKWNLLRWWFCTTQILGAHCVVSGIRIGGTTEGRSNSVPIWDEYGLINGADDLGLGTGNTKLTRKYMGSRISAIPTTAFDTHANGELWIAEFTNALCIVNTDNDEANAAATVDVSTLPGGASEWMRFVGDQDNSINDGTDADVDFDIEPIDGIVLVRKTWYDSL